MNHHRSHTAQSFSMQTVMTATKLNKVGYKTVPESDSRIQR